MDELGRERMGVVYGKNFQRAREQSLQRTRRICCFCGNEPATQAHHWAGTDLAGPYPTDDEVTANDLTPLCDSCHEEATQRRKMTRRGLKMLRYDTALTHWRTTWLSSLTR